MEDVTRLPLPDRHKSLRCCLDFLKTCVSFFSLFFFFFNDCYVQVIENMHGLHHDCVLVTFKLCFLPILLFPSLHQEKRHLVFWEEKKNEQHFMDAARDKENLFKTKHVSLIYYKLVCKNNIFPKIMCSHTHWKILSFFSLPLITWVYRIFHLWNQNWSDKNSFSGLLLTENKENLFHLGLGGYWFWLLFEGNKSHEKFLFQGSSCWSNISSIKVEFCRRGILFFLLLSFFLFGLWKKCRAHLLWWSSQHFFFFSLSPICALSSFN